MWIYRWLWVIASGMCSCSSHIGSFPVLVYFLNAALIVWLRASKINMKSFWTWTEKCYGTINSFSHPEALGLRIWGKYFMFLSGPYWRKYQNFYYNSQRHFWLIQHSLNRTGLYSLVDSTSYCKYRNHSSYSAWPHNSMEDRLCQNCCNRFCPSAGPSTKNRKC